MLNIKKVKMVYIATGATDLRKGVNGLSILVQEEFELDPFSPSIFVFCNKNKDKLKALHWDHSGFWLYAYHLQRGKFKWPNDGELNTLKTNLKELKWLIDGYEIRREKRHPEVKQRLVI